MQGLRRAGATGACGKTGIVMALIICSLCVWCMPAAHAEERGESGDRLILVSVPGLTYQDMDWIQHEPAWEWIDSASYAAMNVRTPERGIEDVYVSIGAGAPALARNEDTAYATGEAVEREGERITARRLYERYNGIAAAESQLVIPTISWVQRRNDADRHSARPGRFGELLKQSGVKRYVFGNRDLAALADGAGTRRHAPLLLADETGRVDGGLIGVDVLEAALDRPYGLRTNHEAMLDSLQRVTGPAIIVFELGDLDRLHHDKDAYSDAQYEQLKRRVMNETGRFVGGLLDRIGPGEAIWVFSPMSYAEGRSQLTPFIALGSGEPGHWLQSDTTRRPGIISYVDLAPTALQWFGVTSIPADMRGSFIHASERIDTVEALQTEVEHIDHVHRLRPRLLVPYVTLQALILLAGLLYMFIRPGVRMRAIVRGALLSILLAPVWLIVAGLYPHLPHGSVMALYGLALILSGIMLQRWSTITALLTVSVIPALCILGDGLLGARLMQHSVLGYDPMIGARYYGIGNELMGVLAGSALLFLSVWQHRHNRSGLVQRVEAVLVLIGVAVYLAAPFWGTNAGGTLTICTALFTYVICSRWWTTGQVRTRSLLASVTGIAAGAAFALALLWLMNRAGAAVLPDVAAGGAKAGSVSHIGKALTAIREGRFDLIIDLLARKVAMNIRLLGISFWSKLLMAGAVVLTTATLLVNRAGLKAWHHRYPIPAAGCVAIAAGAFTAFIANDSGIVAAATMIVYAAVPVLLFGQRTDSHSA